MEKIPIAENFLKELRALASKEQIKKYDRYFKAENGKKDEDVFIGVAMNQVFDLANEYKGMPIGEIEKLLESPIHEARVGAVSIMDWEARNPSLPNTRRGELFQLYIRRHDRINDWDLVDRAAPNVVGGYLFRNPRDILYELAKSENPWERRTAIAATYYFIREDELDDTFKLAEILAADEHEAVQKAVGGFLREAGKHNTQRLLDFLNRRAAEMPRLMLRSATEHLDEKLRQHYLGQKKKS